ETRRPWTKWLKGGLTVGKWIIVIAIVVASLVASAYMLQSMGLIDITQFLTSRIEAIPALQPHVEIYRLGLETRSVLEAERESNLQVQSQLQEEIRQLEAQLEYERS